MPPGFLFVNLSNSELNAFIKGLAYKGHCRPSVHLSWTIYVGTINVRTRVPFPPTSHSSCQEHNPGERFSMVPGRLAVRLAGCGEREGGYAHRAVLWYPTALHRVPTRYLVHTVLHTTPTSSASILYVYPAHFLRSRAQSSCYLM